MTILTAGQARANLYHLIDQVAESHEPIFITGGQHNAVLLSAEDWNAIQETLFLQSAPEMNFSIKQGRAEPLEQSAQKLNW